MSGFELAVLAGVPLVIAVGQILFKLVSASSAALD